MKQDITKDAQFLEKCKWNIKNMQQLGEVDYVTLVSDNNEKIRAHKVVLASVSTTSGTCSRLMIKIQYILWIDPYEISN